MPNDVLNSSVIYKCSLLYTTFSYSINRPWLGEFLVQTSHQSRMRKQLNEVLNGLFLLIVSESLWEWQAIMFSPLHTEKHQSRCSFPSLSTMLVLGIFEARHLKPITRCSLLQWDNTTVFASKPECKSFTYTKQSLYLTT